MSNPRYVLITVAALLAANGALFPHALADVLYQQMPSGGRSAISEAFTDFSDFSTYEFDDLTVGKTGWTVTKLTIFGNEAGDPTLNTAVKLAFTTGADFTLVTTTYDGVEDDNGNLVFDKLNIQLNAGAMLWITAWVERPFVDGGQWFWLMTDTVTGSEEYFHNPGGGFGFGMDPIPGSVVYSSPHDLAFVIEGTTGGQ